LQGKVATLISSGGLSLHLVSPYFTDVAWQKL